ncbi:unnamed protein product [Brassica oleracea var. botrytis]|uniref:BHLH domain-containing protein n=1 Tax=Brassica oleracea TaxID=3712 RepID=A0A679KE86_BRAOL|nr:Unknown [Brassica oleracea]CAA8391689.1 Unknown [Brassica oleracea]CAA8403254.1 Unknown [Brassica oleracea]
MLSYNYQHLGIGRRTDETNSNTNATACDGDGYGENYHRWHGGPPQTKPKVRARRGQATDPHSIAERLWRERIAERMKSLQEFVPNGNKIDKASMLDEIIDYVKFLQFLVIPLAFCSYIFWVANHNL